MVCLYVFPQDYLSASTDLQEVLQLDLNVQEAEQELETVTNLLRESLLANSQGKVSAGRDKNKHRSDHVGNQFLGKTLLLLKVMHYIMRYSLKKVTNYVSNVLCYFCVTLCFLG